MTYVRRLRESIFTKGMVIKNARRVHSSNPPYLRGRGFANFENSKRGFDEIWVKRKSSFFDWGGQLSSF